MFSKQILASLCPYAVLNQTCHCFRNKLLSLGRIYMHVNFYVRAYVKCYAYGHFCSHVRKGRIHMHVKFYVRSYVKNYVKQWSHYTALLNAFSASSPKRTKIFISTIGETCRWKPFSVGLFYFWGGGVMVVVVVGGGGGGGGLLGGRGSVLY